MTRITDLIGIKYPISGQICGSTGRRKRRYTMALKLRSWARVGGARLAEIAAICSNMSQS